MVKRISDYGIKIGSLPRGRLNKITDVEGVRVGHKTIDTRDNKTGLTVVIPSEGNIFREKLVAASHVINGFGKTTGLVQLNELGNLESVIALTNTLNVGKVQDALVDYTIGLCRQDGIELTSFNPVVCECNDSFLNNIQDRLVGQADFYEAIEGAVRDFEEGDVGAGKGMSCHELSGGIGSASRLVKLGGQDYCLGALVLSNYGLLKDLTIAGRPIGQELEGEIYPERRQEEGSIIIILATDLPLTSRQLKRICKRAGVGLSRVGSNISHGSGDIVLGFSTYNKLAHGSQEVILDLKALDDSQLSEPFRAVAEATEEAILNSLISSQRLVGYKGRVREALKDYIEKYI